MVTTGILPPTRKIPMVEPGIELVISSQKLWPLDYEAGPDFSVVGSLATLFMQYFLEDGLEGKVHFPGHIEIPIWHLRLLGLKSCQGYVCMIKNSKPVSYERKNPRTPCSGTKGYAITVWQEVVYRLDIRRNTRFSIVATYFWHVRNYLTFPFRGFNFLKFLCTFKDFGLGNIQFFFGQPV